MPFYEMLPGGMPAGLQSDMDAVLNKKWGTSTTYPPEDWPGTVELMGPLPEKTVSGSVVAFSDGADDVPLKSCKVTIAPTLDGVSSVDVVQMGKNLIDFTQFAIAQTNYLWGYRNVGFPLKKGVTYTFSCSDAVSSLRFVSVDEQTVYAQNSGGATDHLTYTPTDDILVVFRLWSSGISVSWVQLEVGATVTAYTEYVQPTTHTAQLGRTIYGGLVDVVNGTGTSTHGKVTLTAEMIDNAITYTYQGKIGIQINNVFPVNVIRTGEHICSHATVKQGASSDASYMWFGSATGNKYLYWIGVLDTMDMTLEQWKTWALTQTIVCVYEEPTSTAFTFTPVPIISRLGDNTMWSDGDLSVTYRRDIDLALAQ